jgi:hypothetical protein
MGSITDSDDREAGGSPKFVSTSDSGESGVGGGHCSRPAVPLGLRRRSACHCQEGCDLAEEVHPFLCSWLPVSLMCAQMLSGPGSSSRRPGTAPRLSRGM